jgi:anthranilate phosphoribosyltransferase
MLHGAMRFAGPVRKELGFRTIFNLLGPLTNPANAEFQLIGANRTDIAQKLAEAIAQMGRRRAIVVCGADELDEVSLWGGTAVFTVVGKRVQLQTWTPATLGLAVCCVEDLKVQSAAESATVIRDVFRGKPGPARDIVLANAAAALLAAERASEPRAAVQMAADVIDSGKAGEMCERLARTTTQYASESPRS